MHSDTKLTCKQFEWFEETLEFKAYFIESYNEESNKGYFLEGDLQYTRKIYYLYNDFS